MAPASHHVVELVPWFGAPRCPAAPVRQRVDAHEPGERGKALVVLLTTVVRLYSFVVPSSCTFVQQLRSGVAVGRAMEPSSPLRQPSSLGLSVFSGELSSPLTVRYLRA